MDAYLSETEKRDASWSGVIRNLEKSIGSTSTDRARYLSRALALTKAIEQREQGTMPDIRSEQRCSDEDRFRFQDHLANMFATGRLSREEWEIRDEACRTAVIEREMINLLRDLPGLPALPAVPEPQLVSPRTEAAQAAKLKVAGAVLCGVVFSLGAAFTNALSYSTAYGHSGLSIAAIIFGLGAVISLASVFAVVANAAMVKGTKKKGK